jgi:lysine-N-methylase
MPVCSQEYRLPKTTLIRPEYAGKFRCVGPVCVDSCCVGWRVDIDQATFEKYQSIEAGPLRALMDENIVHLPEAKESTRPVPFAQIRMPVSLQCPFHNAEKLCQIQVDLGEEYLSRTCATFPRTTYVIDQLEETTLSLSCPEAARLVLCESHLQPSPSPGSLIMTWEDGVPGGESIRSYFWPIREFAVRLLRNRAYPLWQRMFLLGTLSRRLEGVVRGDVDRRFQVLLKDFSRAVDSGNLKTTIETIPADLTLQLDMVLRLVKLRADNSSLSPRLAESINAFIEGVGLRKTAAMESQSVRYAEACERYFAPFFRKHPHMLENLLVHMIFRNLFPFGKKLFDPEARAQPAREFALLATEFALIKGLMIGVSGCYKEAFSMDHVLQTVQTVFKHFEHKPEFLAEAHQLLVARNLDNAHGLTMLLRN